MCFVFLVVLCELMIDMIVNFYFYKFWVVLSNLWFEFIMSFYGTLKVSGIFCSYCLTDYEKETIFQY